MLKRQSLFRIGMIACGVFVLQGCASNGHSSNANHELNPSQALVHDLDTFTIPVVRVGRYKLMSQDMNVTAMNQLPVTLNLSSDELHLSNGFVRLETAITSVIAQSGYSLCSTDAVDQLITRAVPEKHFQIGPMTRTNLLQVLVGSEWTVQFNQTTGTVCFEPNSDIAGNAS